MDRMIDIADVPFSQVSDEEKEKYVAQIKQTGSYQGYKPRQYWVRAFIIWKSPMGLHNYALAH